jgi:hypothetical protein
MPLDIYLAAGSLLENLGRNVKYETGFDDGFIRKIGLSVCTAY